MGGLSGTNRSTRSRPGRGTVGSPVLTLGTPTLVVRVSGQASKRGLIPRLPAGHRLIGDAEAWLASEYGDAIRSMAHRTLPDSEIELAFDVHPAAPPVLIRANDAGRLIVQADTVACGPGYHRFVGRIVDRLGGELGVDWAGTEAGGDAGLAFADRGAVEQAYLGWLGATLVAARDARRRGAQRIQLGLPGTTTYALEGAVLTALGPRDDDWLERALGSPRVAVEVTPWWADATDARHLLNRALALMWLEVRWRSPAIDDEARLLDEIHRLLGRALPLDPTLAYPWRAWSEIVRLRGLQDVLARQVIERSAREDPADADALIGYRRQPVTIRQEGWRLEIPGSFAERRTGGEWWGGGVGRSISLAAIETGAGGERMSASQFLDQVAGHLGPDALGHRAGQVVGRAKLTTDASSGLEIGVVEGYSAVIGSGAMIRITFDDAADWQWALDTWRALAPA